MFFDELWCSSSEMEKIGDFSEKVLVFFHYGFSFEVRRMDTLI